MSGTAHPFNEDQALALLQRRELTAEMLSSLAGNPEALKSRKVLLAVISHPRTPRHVAIPLLRRVLTFDLMLIALSPTVAADIKRAAEEQIFRGLETVSAGEKITLAKRASGRIAAGLLHDSDQRVIEPALDNPQLTEPLVVQALMKPQAPPVLFQLVSEHQNWCQRREVQIALLRNENTPLQRATEMALNFSPELLRSIIPESRMELLTSSTGEGETE